MGVQGFTSYFKGKSGKGIYLSDESKSQKILIGFDGNALMYYLGEHILSSLGSYVNLRQDIINFFNVFLKNGIEIVVFMDGYTPVGKFQELEKRYESKLKDIRVLVDNLQTPNNSFPFVRVLPPKLLLNQFKSVLMELNIHCHVSFQESDNEMKQWVVDNNGKVYGVFSNDSDFLFFNLGETFYFPLSDLKINGDEILAIGHKSKTTSQSLGVEERYLPMVATLIGNDYTKHLRSKFRGPTSARIDSIVKHMKSYHGVSIQSIIKDNYHRINKEDYETCLDSYYYYIPSAKPKENDKGYTLNDMFYRYSEHCDFPFVQSQTWYKYFFSVACWANYNLLSLMRSDRQQSSVFFLEPRVPYNQTFSFRTSSIRDKLLGLISFELKDNVDYVEFCPNNDSYISITKVPILGEFGYMDCWNEIVTLERRYQELCHIYEMSNQLSKPFSKYYNNDNHSINDLLLVLCCKFLLKSELSDYKSENIKEWMIDVLVLQYIINSLNVEIDKSNFEQNKMDFKPIQLFDYYQGLTSWSATIIDLLAISKYPQRRISSPHLMMDCVVLDLLYKSALPQISKYKSSSSITTQPEFQDNQRFNLDLLFSSFKINDSCSSKFINIKSQIILSILPSTLLESSTTTSTTTSTSLPDISKLNI